MRFAAQVVCDPDRAATFSIAESVRNEFCLKITGKVRPRPAGTNNTNLASGEIEILCHEIEVLNLSVTPPFQLDEDNLSENVRLLHRVIDLRRPQMQNIDQRAPQRMQGISGALGGNR